MKIKDLITELKKYDDDTIVSVDFEYQDSDEGQCYGSIYEFAFELTERRPHNFLTISDGEE